jgi:hypothetical protein
MQFYYSVPATSKEEFVHILISVRDMVGLDTVRGYVISRRPLHQPFLIEGVEREAAEVCRGRPPLPVASYYPRRPGNVSPKVSAATLPLGVIWLDPLGIFRRGREWRVATSCKTKPPLAGWERVSVDAVYNVLHAYSTFYWKFWPRGIRLDPRGSKIWRTATDIVAGQRAEAPLRGIKNGKVVNYDELINDVRGAVSIGEAVHLLIAGGSAAGKTTLIRQLISSFPRFIAIDITHKGEYAQLYPRHVVEGSIDFSKFSPDEKVQLLTIAYAATLGGDQRSFSEVQFGVLRRIRNPQLERVIADIMYLQNVPQLTKDVLVNKLSSLCVEVDEDFRCVPHPSLTKDVLIQPPMVIRITHRGVGDSNFLTALVVHGILLRLLKGGQPEPTLLIIDEYHRIASKVEGIEDPAELQIRIGRHANIHMMIATQNPLDLKPSLLGIIPSVITFQVFGEAAKTMAGIMGVDVEVIEALGQGEWLAKLRSGPKSPEMPRRSP